VPHFPNEKYRETGVFASIYMNVNCISVKIYRTYQYRNIIVASLIKKAGEVVSRQALAEALWGCLTRYTKAIRVYISQIRNNVNKYYPTASFIITYPRTGYMITEANPA
jgi:DNA-binding winged helix-turn-helix (wHTH) protein